MTVHGYALVCEGMHACVPGYARLRLGISVLAAYE